MKTMIKSNFFSPLISVDTGDSAPVKKLNGLVEGGSFDQILDLGDVADSNKGLAPELPTPMMAFEESIQQQSQSAATAGNNSNNNRFIISTTNPDIGTAGRYLTSLAQVVIRLVLADLLDTALMLPFYIFSSRNET